MRARSRVGPWERPRKGAAQPKEGGSPAQAKEVEPRPSQGGGEPRPRKGGSSAQAKEVEPRAKPGQPQPINWAYSLPQTSLLRLQKYKNAGPSMRGSSYRSFI